MNAQETYDMLVQLGDFAKKHTGVAGIEDEVLEGKLLAVTETEVISAIEFARTVLIKAGCLLRKGDRIGNPNPAFIEAICELDKFHSYAHGISTLRNTLPDKVSLETERTALGLEHFFGSFLVEEAKKGRINSQKAHKAIENTERGKLYKYLTWTEYFTQAS